MYDLFIGNVLVFCNFQTIFLLLFIALICKQDLNPFMKITNQASWVVKLV